MGYEICRNLANTPCQPLDLVNALMYVLIGLVMLWAMQNDKGPTDGF
jgi:hypothetical protein